MNLKCKILLAGECMCLVVVASWVGGLSVEESPPGYYSSNYWINFMLACMHCYIWDFISDLKIQKEKDNRRAECFRMEAGVVQLAVLVGTGW